MSMTGLQLERFPLRCSGWSRHLQQELLNSVKITNLHSKKVIDALSRNTQSTK